MSPVVFAGALLTLAVAGAALVLGSVVFGTTLFRLIVRVVTA